MPRIAIIIPAYNNGSTLAEVISGALKHCPDVFVVNDGSNDNTAEILASRGNAISAISFDKNKGKGCALRAGFEKAAACGCTHAITVDGDGQHLTGDIPLFIAKIQEQPERLWVGNRAIDASGTVSAPARSRFGRRFGNFWYRFNTGEILHDTQCGFRAYPLERIMALGIKGSRYEFEQDAIIRAAWNGVPIGEIDIHLNYQPETKRISHFRPVRDFLRISVINGKAAFLRIAFPVATFEAPGKTLPEKIKTLISYELKAHTTPKRAAASVATGVFIGIFPIHGLQVATIMGLAVLLRLNRPLAFLGVCVSSPPFLPFLIIAAVGIGRIVLGSTAVVHYNATLVQKIMQGGLEFIVGSALLAVVAGIGAYIVLLPVFSRLYKAGIFGRKV